MLQWRDDDLESITLVMSLSSAIVPSRHITRRVMLKKAGKREKEF